jgi:hypothetical protein
VKGVRFWNFRDYNNPIPLDPPNPNLQPFDWRTPPPPNVAPIDKGAYGDDA